MLGFLKKSPKEGKDFELVNIGQNFQGVRILRGPFADVLYSYGKISVTEIGGQAKLSFDYLILEPTDSTDLVDNTDFVQQMGDILTVIVDTTDMNSSTLPELLDIDE